jgi:signal transduction histidine kinase
MGGTIELRSRPGETVFTLVLPPAPGETPPRPLVAEVAK